MSGDYFGFIEWLKQHNKKVFVDLKFFDVPATVGRAIKALSSKAVSPTYQDVKYERKSAKYYGINKAI